MKFNFCFTAFFAAAKQWHGACEFSCENFKGRTKMKLASLSALAFASVVGLSTAAYAGPIWVFSSSIGKQVSDVGVVTLTQNGGNSVDVAVDLKDGYGFINTGGQHTPFAFNLSGSGAL